MINSFLMFAVGIILDAVKNKARFLYQCYVNQIVQNL